MTPEELGEQIQKSAALEARMRLELEGLNELAQAMSELEANVRRHAEGVEETVARVTQLLADVEANRLEAWKLLDIVEEVIEGREDWKGEAEAE
jgi:t-SNARE complex subunit (syntaxin)